jgi:hypothetical protein
MNKEQTTKIRGHLYKFEAIYHESARRYTWTAYRRSSYGGWMEIPCWTWAEERTFPKPVAREASAWVERLNDKLRSLELRRDDIDNELYDLAKSEPQAGGKYVTDLEHERQLLQDVLDGFLDLEEVV